MTISPFDHSTDSFQFYTASGNNFSQEKLRITSNGDIVTQGLTNYSFNNDGDNTKVFEVTGDGTVGEYGVINISGNQNADDNTIGIVKFINRENSSSSSGSNAGGRQLGSIEMRTDTGDSNAGDDCGGYFRFITKADGGGNAERLRITSGGLMGLGGVDDPTGTLSIASGTFQSTTPTSTGDDIVISGNQSLGMQFLTLASGTSNNNIYFGDTDDPDIGMIRYAHADNSMQFRTNTEERLRIKSTGYVGINETSPESRLTVFSTDRHVQQLKSETGVTAGTTSGTIYRQQYTSAGTSRRMGFFGIKRDGGSGDQRASFVMELCPDNSTDLGLGSPAASTTAFEFTRTGALKVKDGGGLDFSNTTSASGTTNQLLDDYEEGTHTPTFTNLDVPSHVTTDHFSYTRIGRLVHIEFQFTVSSSVNDASGFQFTLPFGTHGNRNITIPCISTKDSGAVPFAFVHHTNGTNMLAREQTGDYSSLTYNHFSGDTLTGGGTYETDE